MNKAQLVDLFRVYETGLASKARNKSAENAFVSGLYKYYGKTRPVTTNNVRATSKRSKENFERDVLALVKLLESNGPNAKALTNANLKMRQSAVNYYYGITNATKAASNVIALLKAAVASKAPVNTGSFFAKYPNLATGPFRNILNRATNKKKRFQLSRRPSLTASNAQYQALKAKAPNGKYYGNMPIWKTLKASDVDRFTNLTEIQKNALKRMIRSVRLNNMQPDKFKVRFGPNREELSNNLMKIASDKNLLKVIEARVAKRRVPTQWSSNTGGSKATGGSTGPGAPTNIFGSRTTSTNWRNFNK